jgi:hypothetical protein
LKNPITKNKSAGGVVQGIGLEFKPQYHKKKERKTQRNLNIELEKG